MGSLVSRERDHESDFDGEVFRGTVPKAYCPCWGGIGLEDLIVRGKQHAASVLLDMLREDVFEEFLLRVKGSEGQVVVEFGMVFGVVPEPVAVDCELFV